MKIGDEVETILGVGVITDYNNRTNQVAVNVPSTFGQEWFDLDEIDEI